MVLLSSSLQERLRGHRLTLLRGRGMVGGSRRAKRAGKSLEWSDFRPYSAGDELKRIDFKAYARLKKLYIKVYEEEEEGNFVLLLDRSRSMDFGEPGKLEWAKKILALLSFIILNQGERFVFLPLPLDGEKPLFLNTRGMFPYFEDYLWKLQPSGIFPANDEFRDHLDGLPFKGGAYLISDLYLDGEMSSYFRTLKLHSLAFTILGVLSPQELEPPAEGEVQLQDMEKEETLSYLFYDETIEKYRERLNLFLKRIGEEVVKLGGKHLILRSDLGEEGLLLTLLRAVVMV